MELQFVANPKGATNVTIGKTPEHIVKHFDETWTTFRDNEQVGSMTVEFPDAAARRKWFNAMKKYAASLGVVVTKIKGSDSDNPDHGTLTFHMEDLADRVARIEEKKTRAEENKRKREAGEIVKPGRKPAESTPKHFDNVPEV